MLLRLGTLVLAALLLRLRLAAGATTADRSPIHFPWARANPASPRVVESPAHTSASSPAAESIPLEMLLELSDVQNVSYFLDNFVDTSSLEGNIPTELENRFGAENERKSVKIVKPASCEPHLEVVSLVKSTDPRLFYFPTCTRIERCGGCCGSFLECQPIETELVDFKVFVTKYTGGKLMQYIRNEVITHERHTKCECDCRKKATDCNKLQKYTDCQCICINIDEREKCIADEDTKVWDKSTCSCNCRIKTNCSNGYYFDEEICRCNKVKIWKD